MRPGPRIYRLPAPPARLVLLALLALSLACGRGDRPPAAASAATPQRGGSLVTGWGAEPMGVNELTFPANYLSDEMLRQLFLQLVQEQGDSERHPPTFAPQLASSWDWSADHKVLSFHLREAQWSDGVPITADDVRWTWQLQKRPDLGWGDREKKQSITDVEVVDPHTARFHFDHVYAGQLLDANEGSILPKHAWEKLPVERWRESADWFKQHLVVSGPYTLESWQPQQQLVLRRNERYFQRDRPLIDRVVIRIIPNQNSMLTQLQSGDLDLVLNLSPQDAKKVRANPRLQLAPIWGRTWVAVVWNCTRPLLSDPEVRRALTLAIDRQSIVDAIWEGYAQIADSPILNQVWAHDPTLRPWPYQPGEARHILAAKGWQPGPDGVLRRAGQPFAFDLVTNASNQQRVDASVMIQAQLARIGVQVRIHQLEFNTMSDLLTKGSFDASILGSTMDTGLDLTSQFHSSSIGGGNLTRYANPEIDRLIEDSMRKPDIAQALPDLLRIQRILHRDQPYTFIWESQRVNAHNRRVHDVRSNLLYALFQLEDWWLDPVASHAGRP
jgi:peptide/nickel transport system substrate-binding protein